MRPEPTGTGAVVLRAADSTSAPALVLRPWEQGDADALVEVHRDPLLRRWLRTSVDGHEDALRWLDEQRGGWESGDRLSFAVLEDGGASQEPVAHVVLKGLAPGVPFAEVGYWTGAAARGRGVASRALDSLTGWAFQTFAEGGLERLELFHQVGNHASCRVAQKSGYAFECELPPKPPYPAVGHLHVRRRGAIRGSVRAGLGSPSL